jgi:ATP-dependent Clp protease ATP-binding subunit ClpC
MPEAFVLSRFLELARAEARARRFAVLGTPHFFIVLTKLGGVTTQALEAQGQNPKRVRDAIRTAIGVGSAPEDTEPKLTARATANLRRAEALVKIEKGEVVEERHLLLAILEDDEGVTLRTLQELGVDLAALRQAATFNSPTPTLDLLSRDLTLLARRGRLTPLIGRKAELRRIVRTLARKSKNNPVLVGPAGVGKTAIIEGLAQLIAAGNLPELAGMRLVEISPSALVADTVYRGQFEKRVLDLLDEIKRAGNVLLFIDELHTLLRTGAVEGGPLDSANMFKPALARGDVRAIGATTPEAYEQYIVADPTLERRFQPIVISEPTPEEALEILGGVKASYEAHHKVSITREALEAAVNLSVQWFPDRCLPDKAFDLLDEACARVRLPTVTAASKLEGATVTADTVAIILADLMNRPSKRASA